MQAAAALSEHPNPAHAAGEVIGQVLDAIGDHPTLAACFVSPAHGAALDDLVSTVATLLGPAAFVGCTAGGVVAGERGVEEAPAIALWAARLPSGATPVHLRMEGEAGARSLAGLPLAESDSTLLLLAEPYSFPVGDAIDALDREAPGLRLLGGIASAGGGPGANRLVLDGGVVTDGAVGVLLGADAALAVPVVSQGCRPIGRPFTVTRAEGNLLLELAGRSAYERVIQTLRALEPDEQELATRGLHCGIAVDERKLELERGDFLVRNVLGADPGTGAVAVGAVVPVGATVQLQVRDAGTAWEDLEALLVRFDAQHGRPGGGLLFTCNGRGANLFGTSHHDARVTQAVLGPVPLAGFFCAGEIGPIAGRNALHGFTASLALFPSAAT